MSVDHQNAFGDRLRAVLQRRGMEQQQLAKQLGVQAGTISAWMTKGALPKGDTLLGIASALDVDVHWLLTGQHHGREGATEAERKLAAIRRILDDPPVGDAREGGGGSVAPGEDGVEVVRGISPGQPQVHERGGRRGGVA